MERTVETSSSSQSLMGRLCQPNIFEICQAPEPNDNSNGSHGGEVSPGDPFGYNTPRVGNKTKRVTPVYFIMIGGVAVGLLLIGLVVYICHIGAFHKMGRTVQTNPLDDDITVSIEQDEDDDSSTVEA
jgi:hypothetical protein